MTRTNTYINQTISIEPMVERIDLNQMLTGGVLIGIVELQQR